MNKAERINDLVREQKSMMLAELKDLVEATSILANELGIMHVYTTPLDGKTTVHFYSNKFPFDAEEIEKKSTTIFEKDDQVKWSVTVDNIEFMCYAPKEV